MRRECTHCKRPFNREDFVKEESKHMEADRKALGVEGVHFLHYRCPACSYEDVFVDLHPLERETPDQFASRRKTLEASLRRIRASHLEVVLRDRTAPTERSTGTNRG